MIIIPTKQGCSALSCGDELLLPSIAGSFFTWNINKLFRKSIFCPYCNSTTVISHGKYQRTVCDNIENSKRSRIVHSLPRMLCKDCMKRALESKNAQKDPCPYTFILYPRMLMPFIRMTTYFVKKVTTVYTAIFKDKTVTGRRKKVSAKMSMEEYYARYMHGYCPGNIQAWFTRISDFNT